jgi:hypothetical protein
MKKPIPESALPELLASLKERQFFGKVTIEYHRGQAKLVRTEETQIVEGETQHHGNLKACPS